VRAWEFEARSQLRDFTAAVTLCLAKYTAGQCAAMDYESRTNITYQMIPQTNTDVLIRVQHAYGGSAFQSDTAASGRIERIPRFL
jgi:hypothetical protein